jgi:uncharacterized damage-inducible protein DinB
MNAKDLLALFGATEYTFNSNMADITHEMSLIPSGEGGSCVNWIAGHVLRTRQDVLQLLSVDVVINPDDMPQYIRGEGFTSENALPIEEIQSMMKETMSRFTRGVAKISQESLDEMMEKPFLGQKVTRGRMMGLFSFHESYHVGQIGVFRRLLGLDGVIRV